MVDADRIEQLSKRDRGVAEIDLVIPHPDVVIGITVDDENFGITARLAEFVKFARRADRGPQARKSCAKDKDPRHAPLPTCVASWIWFSA
jgi:hypothetical protein